MLHCYKVGRVIGPNMLIPEGMVSYAIGPSYFYLYLPIRMPIIIILLTDPK